MKGHDCTGVSVGKMLQNRVCFAMPPKRTWVRIHLARPEVMSREQFLTVYVGYVFESD